MCTIVRLAYVHDLSNATVSFFGKLYTYLDSEEGRLIILATSKPIGLLSLAEMSIGVTCISLACYKPLFHRYFGRRASFYYSDGTYHGQHGQGVHGLNRYSARLENESSNRQSFSTQFSPTSRHESHELKGYGGNSEVSSPFQASTSTKEVASRMSVP